MMSTQSNFLWMDSTCGQKPWKKLLTSKLVIEKYKKAKKLVLTLVHQIQKLGKYT